MTRRLTPGHHGGVIPRAGAYLRRNHLALLALFFALGGSAYAAGSALLPKNSVGSRQVVNGSLQISGSFKIQQVDISFDIKTDGECDVYFDVTASTTRFSFEDMLRQVRSRS